MNCSTIELTPANSAVGAFVSNISLAEQLSDEVISELLDAHANYGVLFFRDQQLTEEQQISLAEQLGEINVNRFFTRVVGYPKIAEVRKEPDQTFNIGGGWHTDQSSDVRPAMGSILYALELPELGGDPLFASTYASYEAVSDGLKEMLSGLSAVHSSRHVFGAAAARPDDIKGRLGNAEAATQDAVHPVVIEHPRSGRKSLYVNPDFTLHFAGWTAEESAPLLQYLYRHMSRPEFTYRFQWRPGSLAFWDNRATWHYAVNDYHGARRLLHRITLEGEPLRAAG